MYEVIDVLAKVGYEIVVTAHSNGLVTVGFAHAEKPSVAIEATTTRQALIIFISRLLQKQLEA